MAGKKTTAGVVATLAIAGAISLLALVPERQSSASLRSAETASASTTIPRQAAPDGLLLRTGCGSLQPAATDKSTSAALPVAVVHKSPTCSCCEAWISHLKQEGFRVQVHETDNLQPIKQRLGVPRNKVACHTAQVGRYVIEGHVPASDIKRLLAEGGTSKGLVLPGMPAGSPGMGVPDGPVPSYTVERIDAQGATHPFATHTVP